MMKNLNFKKYKNLKTALEGYDIYGIPLDKLAGFFIASIVYNADKNKQLDFFVKLKNSIRFFFFIPKIKKISTDNACLFGWGTVREDYTRLSNAYKKEMGCDFDSICLSAALNGFKFYFNFYAFFFALFVTFKINKIKIKDRIVVFKSIYASVSFLNFMKNNFRFDNVKKYLSFNSSNKYESVFTLYLRYFFSNVETYSMQHGMYFNYQNEIPLDVINFENVMANNILVWGEFTAEQIKDHLYEDVKVKIFGNPLYQDKEILTNSYNPSSNNILVCLPRVIYQKEIFDLVELIKSQKFNSFSFFLRPHPSFDKRILSAMISKVSNIKISSDKSMKEEFNISLKAVIGFNSTSLFESIFYGVPVLQFVSGNDEFLNAGFFEFTNEKQLNSFLNTSILDSYVVNRDLVKSYFG